MAPEIRIRKSTVFKKSLERRDDPVSSISVLNNMRDGKGMSFTNLYEAIPNIKSSKRYAERILYVSVYGGIRSPTIYKSLLQEKLSC